MNTLELHAQVNGYMQSIATALQALDHSFRNVAPRTTLDNGCIDALTVQAQALIAKAAELKTVAYSPNSQS